jgi:uncharacterized protein YyaL (SSP411 family)
MARSKVSRWVVAGMLLAGVVLSGTSCRNRAASSKGRATGPLPTELGGNRLGGIDGALYRSAAGSSIRWQPWTSETLSHARDAGRMVLVVTGLPQQPGFGGVLEVLESTPEVKSILQSEYVPVLVDADAAREWSVLAADLCAEIRKPVSPALFLWMSYEGHPIAWVPAPLEDPSSAATLFVQAHGMASRIWKDDSDYVLRNSASDNANRIARIRERKISNRVSSRPAEDAFQAIRRMCSYLDRGSGNLDEAGGLFPSASIEVFAVTASRPGVPAELRDRCRETLRTLLASLLRSAMFDPLDGGVFSARVGRSWDLPAFARDCPKQARAAGALFRAHRATGDPLALERASGVLAFAEREYRTDEGLFALGLHADVPARQWMWGIAELREALAPEDAEWWTRESDLRELGNLPPDVDSRRRFFRLNSLRLTKSPAQYAAESPRGPEAFLASFDASRRKLLEVRKRRMSGLLRDTSPHAASSFRMVSAYAEAFTTTRDEAYRRKAVDLLTKSREAFSEGSRLKAFRGPFVSPVNGGRAFLYALALQAALDVADITGEERWLLWSEDLATTAAELFTGDGFLKECEDDANLTGIPVTDLVMLFDDSTAGLVSATEVRLAAKGRPLVESFSSLATPLPSYVPERPMLHTDLLLATLLRQYPVTAVSGHGLSEDMARAVLWLPLREVERRPAREKDDVPDGKIRLLLPGERTVLVSTPEELRQALLPQAGE